MAPNGGAQRPAARERSDFGVRWPPRHVDSLGALAFRQSSLPCDFLLPWFPERLQANISAGLASEAPKPTHSMVCLGACALVRHIVGSGIEPTVKGFRNLLGGSPAFCTWQNPNLYDCASEGLTFSDQLWQGRTLPR